METIIKDTVIVLCSAFILWTIYKLGILPLYHYDRIMGESSFLERIKYAERLLLKKPKLAQSIIGYVIDHTEARSAADRLSVDGCIFILTAKCLKEAKAEKKSSNKKIAIYENIVAIETELMQQIEWKLRSEIQEYIAQGANEKATQTIGLYLFIALRYKYRKKYATDDAWNHARTDFTEHYQDFLDATNTRINELYNPGWKLFNERYDSGTASTQTPVS